MTFEQFLDRLQPPMTSEQKARAISDHEVRERHALCHRIGLRDSGTPTVKEILTVAPIPKVGTIIPKMVMPKVEPTKYY
jgi:hypothetical protein